MPELLARAAAARSTRSEISKALRASLRAKAALLFADARCDLTTRLLIRKYLIGASEAASGTQTHHSRGDLT